VAVAAVIGTAAEGRVLMTQQQALQAAFPKGTKLVRQPLFLTAPQIAAATKASGVAFDDQLVVRYVGMNGNQIAGFAYFDSHRVRTLPETLMILLTPDGRISRVDVLSFSEPADYFPRERWLDQFRGAKLDDDLSLRKGIRPITGASLTGRAIVNASRKVLAIHQAVQGTK
jgi:hypothetical protein